MDFWTKQSGRTNFLLFKTKELLLSRSIDSDTNIQTQLLYFFLPTFSLLFSPIFFSLLRDFGVRWWLCWVGQGSYHRQWILPRWLLFKINLIHACGQYESFCPLANGIVATGVLLKLGEKIVITSVCGQIVFMPAHWVCLDNRKLWTVWFELG